MRVAPVLLALVLALAAIGLACVPAATPLPTATPTGERAVLPTPTPAPPARPPIITEAQAIEMGTFMTRFGGPEVSGSQQVRNPEARLMTLAEFEDRFSGYQSTGDRSRPVWVVTVEGEWSDAGIVPPEY
ncbi:MAG: hypothetical protein Q8O40_09865, partial [Chloroflexota bacterium]|nr:hypothetical protein [Chloroflexota bacterium]